MKTKGRRISATLLAGALVLCGASASGQTDRGFYAGQQMQVLIGFDAGGSNDIWGRVVARHIGRHLAGNPAVVAQNMPGAGSMRLANYLYNVAPRDGTVIGIIARGIPLEPLMGGKGAKFEATKFAYLGTPTRDTTICAVDADLPHKTLEDYRRNEVIVGSSGSGAETNVIPLLLNNVLGMKFRIISGYKGGGTDVILAIARKEVQGVCFAYENLERQSLYKEGKIRAAFQVSSRSNPNLPGVPNVFEVTMTDEQREVLKLIFVREDLGRPFVAPPGLPAARAAELRAAFDATMKDAAFVAEAKGQRLSVIPTGGKALADVVAAAYRAPENIVKKAAAALGR